MKSNWFPPPEASQKRSRLQNLIYDIFDDNSLKAPAADCLDKAPSSEVLGIIKHKVEAGSLGGNCCPSLSPVRVASCSSESRGVFKDLQGPVVNSYSPNCLQMSVCRQGGFMSPIEVNEFLSLN